MNTEKLWAEAIAKDYAPKNTSKMAALRKLNQRAKRPANVFAYTFGIAASLVAGLGMCLAMGVIGSGGVYTAVGIALGLIGFGGWGVNVPLYRRLLEKGKAKYAYEIVELARQISEEQE